MHTKSFLAGALVSVFLLLTQHKVNGQTITEYGKQMGGTQRGLPTTKQNPFTMPSGGKKGGQPTETQTQFDAPPADTIPSTLTVKRSMAYLYAQQDDQSPAINKLDQGEKLIPVGKAYGGGETWYMVRTQKGALGWVRSSDIAEIGKGIN